MVVMASMTSMMRCRAESVPMVMSVPQKSLSMEPTSPAMLRCEYVCAVLSEILPGRGGSPEAPSAGHAPLAPSPQVWGPSRSQAQSPGPTAGVGRLTRRG